MVVLFCNYILCTIIIEIWGLTFQTVYCQSEPMQPPLQLVSQFDYTGSWQGCQTLFLGSGEQVLPLL